MKASVLEGLNQPMVLKEVPTPTPVVGEVLVQLKAAALNHRDVWIQKGKYPGLKFPCILGADGAGVVAQVGEGIDRSLVGREVLINPGLFWGNNPRVQSKEFRILGMPDDGTFAQYIRIAAAFIVPKPEHLSFEEAAALPLAGITAYRALFGRAGLQAGEKVLVTGVGGGVALFAVQFALAAGAEVYVTSGSEEKIQRAVALGARGGVNYKEENWYKSLMVLAGQSGKSGGFDVIIDSAGGEAFNQLVELAAPGGRIAFYGATRGNWKDAFPQRIFFKQLSILGSTMGSSVEFEAMVNFVAEKKIKPVVDQVFPLAEAESAFRRLEQAGQFGKIVLQIS